MQNTVVDSSLRPEKDDALMVRVSRVKINSADRNPIDSFVRQVSPGGHKINGMPLNTIHKSAHHLYRYCICIVVPRKADISR